MGPFPGSCAWRSIVRYKEGVTVAAFLMTPRLKGWQPEGGIIEFLIGFRLRSRYEIAAACLLMLNLYDRSTYITEVRMAAVRGFALSVAVGWAMLFMLAGLLLLCAARAAISTWGFVFSLEEAAAAAEAAEAEEEAALAQSLYQSWNH